MTTVVIRKDKAGSYQGFTCMGHAGYARKRLFFQEKDVLCAGISALVINTVNALEELAGERFSSETNEETGFMKFDFAEPLQEKSVFLLDAMVFGLQQMSREYGETYLQVKFEEV